jgi:diadenosine tetraphosphate (Ap4A) HIT family hydrolase
MNDFKLYESTHHIIYLYVDGQLYLGRSVVVLKSKKQSLSQMDTEEWIDFGIVANIFETALKQCFNATYFNWGCFLNDAYRTKPFIPEVHWQVRPRYERSIIFEGIEFTDEAFGSQFLRKDREKKLNYEFIERIFNRMLPYFPH